LAEIRMAAVWHPGSASLRTRRTCEQRVKSRSAAVDRIGARRTVGSVQEVLEQATAWRRAGRRVAIARVVEVVGSGPREPGAAMAVTDRGEVAGSVSGGCVESAVVTEALEVLDRDERRLVTFGYGDADAMAVGLTCGGTIHLFLEPLDW
jgi:xanthine dehydrogenase accessory factor